MLDVDAVQCSDAVNYRHRTPLIAAAAAAVLRLAVHVVAIGQFGLAHCIETSAGNDDATLVLRSEPMPITGSHGYGQRRWNIQLLP